MMESVWSKTWDGVAEFSPDAQPPQAWTWGDTQRLPEIVESLGRSVSPSTTTSEPWAAVVRRGDGSVAAAASMTVGAGLFYSRISGPENPRLVIGPSLGDVIRARGSATELSPSFLGGRLGTRRIHPAETPYREVHRLPPGTTALWRSPSSNPELSQWCGPASWPAPEVDGPAVIDTYRRTFDAVVDELVIPGEPICATLSGGLDSSFLVASLLRHATPARPVHAFVHSPRAAAGLEARGNWDPDDFPVALSMLRMYPETLKVHRVVNGDAVLPLDEATVAAELHWYPAVNVTNLGWLRRMSARAAELGASRLFIGQNGNAAFSYGHPYALGYHLRQHQWRALMSLATAYPQGSAPGVRTGWINLARRAAGELRARSHPRADYLNWLAAANSRATILAFAGWDAAMIDPFRSSPVVDLAASMTPAAWARGGTPRGLARLIGEGRVPDEIRLRTRRGGQSWDSWFLSSGSRERYFEEARLAMEDPDLNAHMSGLDLCQELSNWPWGQPLSATPARWNVVLDVLATAAFTRLTRQRLESLP